MSHDPNYDAAREFMEGGALKRDLVSQMLAQGLHVSEGDQALIRMNQSVIRSAIETMRAAGAADGQIAACLGFERTVLLQESALAEAKLRDGRFDA